MNIQLIKNDNFRNDLNDWNDSYSQFSQKCNKEDSAQSKQWIHSLSLQFEVQGQKTLDRLSDMSFTQL